MSEDKIAALEELAHKQNEVLLMLVAHVQALALTNASLVASLGDTIDRAAIRQTALSELGEGPTRAQAAALIETFTQEHPSNTEGHEAAISSLAAAVSRLQ